MVTSLRPPHGIESQPDIAESTVTVAFNLRALMDQREMSEPQVADATKGVVSQKTVNNILNLRVNPGTDKVEALAKAFGLEPFQMYLPDITTELVESTSINRIIADFTLADESGKDHIARTAELMANRAKNNPDQKQ